MHARPSPAAFRARPAVECVEERLAPATFTVTNTNDTGSGSFREAILHANAHPGADTIAFAIGSGLQTIKVLAPLPEITDPVNIGGQTQPGYAGNPLIDVNGDAAGAGVNGLVIREGGSGSVVRGLVLEMFNGDAVRVQASNCRIVRNYIGLRPDGHGEESNGGNGILIYGPASGNIVARNVISGDDINGVFIFGSGANGNRVVGNLIGTDVTGTVRIANGVSGTPSTLDGAGVRIAGGASGNVIGGTAPGTRNVISANTDIGVAIDDAGSSGNMVLGNFIGLDINGDVIPGNSLAGVLIDSGASGNVIGGRIAAAHNVISGNNGDGVIISDAGTTRNHVLGNRIGLATTSSANRGNTGNGVTITSGASGNVVGSAAAGGGNVIADNDGSGVSVVSGSGNAILGNRIVANAVLGIDLGNDGVTPNDTDDTDLGANDLLNFPVLSEATITAIGLRIRGSINTETNKTIRIEFFDNPNGDGEGAKYLGFITVQTGASNTAGFVTLFSASGVNANDVVTATATDEAGNTSEFSAALAVI